MAVDSMNDSYNRCLAELRARYKDRGVATNMKNELIAREKADAENTSRDNNNYVLFYSQSKIADTYRSGEYNGSKYMTSDDFVRYFRNRRSFYMPSTVRESEVKAREATVKNTALPQRKGSSSGNRGLVNAEQNSKEGHLATAGSVIKTLIKEWFPVERREGRTEGQRFRMPVAAMSGIAVFVISLGLIVGGSVMTGSASAELGLQNRQIATLEAQANELQGKLDLKYNVGDIEAEAKSLGMIKRQYADNEYLTVGGKEKITIYEDQEQEEKEIGLLALLSSFGIELGK